MSRMAAATEQFRGPQQHPVRPAALLFINTTHPSHATSKGSLSKIRAHATKEIRLRARENQVSRPRPKKNDGAVVTKPRKRRAKYEADAAITATSPPAGESDKDRNASMPQTTYYYQSKLSAVEESVIATLDLYRLASWSPVRPFSDRERLLFDHYLHQLVPIENWSCHRVKQEDYAKLVRNQLNYWIPFAVSDLGVIDALFLQSSRSLELLNAVACQNYEDMSAEYRLQCIQSTHADLANEDKRSSDATIAKVYIMAGDEMLRGNLVGWRAHRTAITKMVQMRGGVDALGVGGFLKEVIVNTTVFTGY